MLTCISYVLSILVRITRIKLKRHDFFSLTSFCTRQINYIFAITVLVLGSVFLILLEKSFGIKMATKRDTEIFNLKIFGISQVPRARLTVTYF